MNTLQTETDFPRNFVYLFFLLMVDYEAMFNTTDASLSGAMAEQVRVTKKQMVTTSQLQLHGHAFQAIPRCTQLQSRN